MMLLAILVIIVIAILKFSKCRLMKLSAGYQSVNQSIFVYDILCDDSLIKSFVMSPLLILAITNLANNVKKLRKVGSISPQSSEVCIKRPCKL